MLAGISAGVCAALLPTNELGPEALVRTTVSVCMLEPTHACDVVVQSLELAVPGTYLAGEPVVTIAAFAPQLTVITSKQRPRKLTIHGSDGAEYMFLLKANPPWGCCCAGLQVPGCATC